MYERNWKDYYEILQVNQNAEQSVIAAAYKRLAQTYHPDVNPGDKAAEAKFKDINEANEILSNPTKRAKYDRAYRMRNTSQPKKKTNETKVVKKGTSSKAITKKRTAKKAVEKVPVSEVIEVDQKGRWTRYIIVAVFIAIIGIIVGVNHYISTAPFRTVIIRVDDTSIRMDYFLKRLRINPVDPTEMLSMLSREKIIELVAPMYVGELTDEDLEQEIKRIASGGSGDISENEYKEWYRQQLNESGFTDAEFKNYMTTTILATRMHEYLSERVPTVAEQIHVHMIVVQTYDEAMEVRTRWEEGEDFADLAREVSLDEQSKENGGDLGWIAQGVDDLIDYVAWDLGIDQVSQPVSEYGNYFYLFKVSEREAVRILDEDNRLALQSKVLDNWLNSESPLHNITFHGLNKGRGFDSETYAWINWQLARE